jgi:hypothetical protein
VAERDAKQEDGMYALEVARVDLATSHFVEGEKWLQSVLDTNPELVPTPTELGVIRADKGDTAGAESERGNVGADTLDRDAEIGSGDKPVVATVAGFQSPTGINLSIAA